MKKLAVLCVAVLGAALLVLGSASSASAYPEVTCDLTASPHVVHPGDTFTATGTVRGADTGKPVSWTFRWNGVTRHRTTATAQATFKAPDVAHTRTIPLTGRSTFSVNGEARTCVHHVDVKVVAAEVSAP